MNIYVLCVNRHCTAAQVVYRTSQDSFYNQENACPECGSYKAKQVD